MPEPITLHNLLPKFLDLFLGQPLTGQGLQAQQPEDSGDRCFPCDHDFKILQLLLLVEDLVRWLVNHGDFHVVALAEVVVGQDVDEVVGDVDI